MTDVILKDPVLDGGIEVLNTVADAIWVCNGTPVNYGDAEAKVLGSKTFSPGAVFGSPTNATPNGRQVTSVAVTDGIVGVSGTVTCWAVIDTVNDVLLAVGNLTGGMAVTAGWAWTLDAFTIRCPVTAATLSAEASQFLVRITDPGPTRSGHYAALIDGLVADGVWSSLDVLHVYAADISANALVNLKNSSHTGTLVGTTFTADRGFNFASGSDYVHTHFDVSAGTNFLTDAASIGVWTSAHGGDAPMVEDTLTSGHTNLFPSYASTAYARINDATASSGFGVASGVGFLLGVRTSSTGRTAYRNKVSIGTYGSVASGAPTAGQSLLVGSNTGGQAAAFCAGGNIDAVQDKLYDHLRTYMTAVGVS